MLVLGAFVHPSLAATGSDTSCYQPIDAPPMTPSLDRKLTISVINRSATRAAATTPVELDDTSGPDADTPPDTADVAADRAGPHVETMLRRIFDDAQARQPTLSQPETDDDFSAPFAVDKSENVDEPAGVLDADPVEGTTELPGFGADELLRYREQMYRTDI